MQVRPAEHLHERPADLSGAWFFGSVNEVEAVAERGEALTALGDTPGTGLPFGPAISAITPQGLGTPGDGVAGRVAAEHVPGEVDLVELGVKGGENRLKARVCGNRIPVGSEVGIRLNLADVRLFAKIGE